MSCNPAFMGHNVFLNAFWGDLSWFARCNRHVSRLGRFTESVVAKECLSPTSSCSLHGGAVHNLLNKLFDHHVRSAEVIMLNISNAAVPRRRKRFYCRRLFKQTSTRVATRSQSVLGCRYRCSRLLQGAIDLGWVSSCRARCPSIPNSDNIPRWWHDCRCHPIATAGSRVKLFEHLSVICPQMRKPDVG